MLVKRQSNKSMPVTAAALQAAVEASRAVLEAGGVFSPTLLNRVVTLLRA